MPTIGTVRLAVHKNLLTVEWMPRIEHLECFGLVGIAFGTCTMLTGHTSRLGDGRRRRCTRSWNGPIKEWEAGQ